jgi:hypothetical protein
MAALIGLTVAMMASVVVAPGGRLVRRWRVMSLCIVMTMIHDNPPGLLRAPCWWRHHQHSPPAAPIPWAK